MSTNDQSPDEKSGKDPIFHYAIQLLALALLLVWSFLHHSAWYFDPRLGSGTSDNAFPTSRDAQDCTQE